MSEVTGQEAGHATELQQYLQQQHQQLFPCTSAAVSQTNRYRLVFQLVSALGKARDATSSHRCLLSFLACRQMSACDSLQVNPLSSPQRRPEPVELIAMTCDITSNDISSLVTCSLAYPLVRYLRRQQFQKCSICTSFVVGLYGFNACYAPHTWNGVGYQGDSE
jgi:hypothetical protein